MIEIKPPALRQIVGEGLTGLELPRLLAAAPLLALQNRGNRRPVMVLPGYGASDASTILLRSYLSWLGYDVRGWGLGTNGGNVALLLPDVQNAVEQMHKQANQAVHLIGWSLGGVLAREVARNNPVAVQQVITMGSPIIGGPKYTSMAKIYLNNGVDLDEIERRISERDRTPIKVPVTSVYSKNDGVVAWRASIDHMTPGADNIEVRTTHLGFGLSPEVFKLLAKKLSRT
ncbi:MAG: alpha/beta hydrolase [Pseudomonadota bacterium]